MPLNVLIAGAGPTAIEAALGVRQLAGDRVAITLLAPDHDLVYRPSSVTEPFGMGATRRYALDAIAADLAMERVRDVLEAVDPSASRVRTRAGLELAYDALIVATGAGSTPALRHAQTFWGPADADSLHGLVQDVEAGYSRSVAFVVPPGASWPLPLYELALLTAECAYEANLRPELHLVTTEDSPLALFGTAASVEAAALLERAGITFHGSVYAHCPEQGRLVLRPSGGELRTQRVVALPRVVARRVGGLPATRDGYVPIDGHGRVRGVAGVYAAGDVTDFPLKQGGLATQQADAVAEAVAAAAGAQIEPEPFKPVLRGMLITGTGGRWMTYTASGGDGGGTVSSRSLWWPPTKIAGRRLAPYLERRDAADAGRAWRGGVPVEGRLDARARRGAAPDFEAEALAAT